MSTTALLEQFMGTPTSALLKRIGGSVSRVKGSAEVVVGITVIGISLLDTMLVVDGCSA